MLLLGAGVLCVPVLAAQASGDKPAPAQVKDAAPTDFVGSETCATCHDEVAKKFADNPHTKMALMHGNAAGVTCENCHGAGKGHVDGGGDVSKIFNPSKASAKEVDAKCLGCHAGAHPNFERAPHAKAGVSCIGCHSVHAAGAPDHLLKAAQPTLCFQCHTDVKPQFSMPFHHKVNEGLVQCTACHDPHGTYNKKNLKSSAQRDQVCVKCHTELAGPFVYEHAPVEAEGCTACHSPHGSQNARMLNSGTVNDLCTQCHSPTHNFSTQFAGHNQNGASDNTCTICHTAIHGSNTSKIFASTY
jgi:DmsE family decaheme c-type cytochrome